MIFDPPWLLAALVIWFLASPPALAWITVRAARRRAARDGIDPRRASRRFSRWLAPSWLLYLVNVLAAGAYLATSDARPDPAGLPAVGAALLLLVVALVPALLIARVTRAWERSLGHPGGAVTLRVEARAWFAWVGSLAAGVGAALAGISLWGPAAGVVGGAAMVAAYLTVYPDLFRWIWGAYPLPDDEQGRRIRSLLSTQKAPVHRVLVIPAAHGAAANAFVSGVVDRRRYLFLTELLLRRLAPEEVDAVVAHEIGHLHHRHVARLGAAFIGTAVMVAAALLGAGGLVLAGASPGVRASFHGLAGFVIVLSSLMVTRRLARRYEFEADDFSARALGGGEPMARALRKIGRDNWLVEDELGAGRLASHPTVERRAGRLLSR